MSQSKFSPHRLLIATFCLVALLAATGWSSSHQLKRTVGPNVATIADSESDRIVFKLVEGIGQPELRGKAFMRTGASFDRLNTLLSSSGKAASVQSRFKLDKPTLDRLREEGSRRIGQQLPDLTLYYEIAIPVGFTAQERLDIVNELAAMDVVEVAYFAPKPDIASATTTSAATPAWESQQYYLEPAPTGVNAFYGWGFPGGTGENVKVIDIEGNWIETHEDLHGGTDNFHIAGTRINDPGWWNHGTAVLGEIASDSNDFGMTGISYGVDLGTVSIGSMSTADAIATASANAVAGDIILIELHAPGPHYDFEVRSDQRGYVAMEYWQENFDAILTASALGQIVVEAAGNGAENYDDIAIYDSLFYPEHRFSGAIMVAASDASHVPASFTNYGLRIDVHGFGAWDVYTLGYGDLYGSSPDDYYTSSFSGTSSASPIIVGSCAILQGIHKNLHGYTLDHAGMRYLLTTYSTPQSPHAKRIGPLPDMFGSCDEVYGVSFTSDITSGWVPLEVNFSGTSGMPVDTWTWDFGDGGFAFEQSPTYSYNGPGMFDVSLEINSGGDIRVASKENYIIALADTMKASDGSAGPGEQVEVVVSGNNTVPIQYIRIPVEYPGDLSITWDSFSTVGCRTEYFETQTYLHYDPFSRRNTIKLVSSETGSSPDLEPGSGDIVKFYWTIHSSATEGQTAAVLLGGYSAGDDYAPEYQGDYLDYVVEVVSSQITVGGACCAVRGDTDHSGDLNPLDATYFVNWLWKGGAAPPCEEEGDVDGSGDVNPLDATYLVAYLWGGGPAPVGCP